jgi:ribosomal protein S20
VKSIYTELRVAFEKAIKAEDAKTASSVWFNTKKDGKNVKSGLQSTIDKLVKKNIIHRNNAARKKAHFARELKNLATAK